jgi:hypothetical protein
MEIGKFKRPSEQELRDLIEKSKESIVPQTVNIPLNYVSEGQREEAELFLTCMFCKCIV